MTLLPDYLTEDRVRLPDEFSTADVADAIDTAHDQILVGGWTRKQAKAETGERCMIGGVHTAGQRLDYNLRQLAICAIAESLKMDGWVSRRRRYSHRYQPGDDIVDYNDEPGRTLDEVLDALRLAAKRVRDGIIDPHALDEARSK